MMEKRKNQALTRGEEEIMQLLWKLGEGNVNDLLAAMNEPKPKYTTVATFLKILEEKRFVARKPNGRGYSYYPIVEKSAYAQRVMTSVLGSYFDGSLVQLVSFFSKRESIPMHEMEEIAEIIRTAKDEQRAEPQDESRDGQQAE